MNETQNMYINSYNKYLNKQRKHPFDALALDQVNRNLEIASKKELLSTAGVDVESGNIDLSKFKNLSVEEKLELIKALIDIYNLNNSDLVLALVKKVKNSLEKEVAKESNPKEQEKAQSVVYFSSTKTAEREIVNLKAKEYGDFMFEKAKNSFFTATTTPTISTHKLENLSRAELVSMFNPKVFYSLSSNQRNILFQAVVNDYLKENNIKPCAVTLANLPLGGTTICYGNYSPARGVIQLNSKLFDNIDSLSDTQNQYFPYKVLSTLIHETQHRVQFMNIDNIATSEADYEIKQSLLAPQQDKSFANYLAEPDELDARNASLSYFSDLIKNRCEDPKEIFTLCGFYNQTLHQEKMNGKANVSSALKRHNPEIYSSCYFKTPGEYQLPMQNAKSEMSEILLGKSNELSKSLRSESF